MGFLVALNTNNRFFLDALSTHSMNKIVDLSTRTLISFWLQRHREHHAMGTKSNKKTNAIEIQRQKKTHAQVSPAKKHELCDL